MQQKNLTGSISPTRKRRWQARSLQAAEERDFLLLLIPELLGLLLLFIGPLVAVVGISLLTWDGLTKAKWHGLGNYQALFHDSLFWQSLYNTAYYTVLTVGVGTIVAFGVALLWNQPLRGITVYRTLYYVPVIVPAVAGSVVWGLLLNPSFGLINVILNWVGLPSLQWLQSTATAKPAIALLGLWTIGNAAVIYLAGLKSIPSTLYEAAKIDGSGPVGLLFRITVPMMTPTLMFNIIMSVVASSQVFTPAYVLTGGGPINSTLFYVLYLYQNAFQNFLMGYASAQAVILLVITFAFSLIIVRFFQDRMFYD